MLLNVAFLPTRQLGVPVGRSSLFNARLVDKKNNSVQNNERSLEKSFVGKKPFEGRNSLSCNADESSLPTKVT